MTDRIDHAAEARKHITYAHEQQEQEGDMGNVPRDNALLAQAEAMLALVEQQRIANLIALSQACDGNGWQAQEPLSAVFAYTHPDPEDGFEGLHVRPEIREALGI